MAPEMESDDGGFDGGAVIEAAIAALKVAKSDDAVLAAVIAAGAISIEWDGDDAVIKVGDAELSVPADMIAEELGFEPAAEE